MPFGLYNAPATFQRLMNVAMAALDPLVCFVYLDDIIVHSKNLHDHLNRLRLLFDTLLATGLKLKVSKCRLLRTEVGFLRHWVNAKGLATDPAKIEAVREWPTPRCLWETRAFLGLCSYYRKFLGGFANIAAPARFNEEKQVVHLGYRMSGCI